MFAPLRIGDLTMNRFMVSPMVMNYYLVHIEALSPDTAVWIEGKKSCESDWKSYVQTVVTLL